MALGLALLTAGLGFGGQPRSVLLVAAVLSVIAVAFSPSALPLSRLTLGLLALSAFTALQAVPLPFGLVELLSPRAADVWAGVLRPFHEGSPAWVTLSVDPAATWLEVVKLTSCACLAAAGAGVRARRGSPAVAALAFGASLAVCLVTLAHGIVRAPLIYGTFTPVAEAERWTRGPFVNSNNLAQYLNLGLFAGAGLWLSGRSPLPAFVTGAGVPLLAAGVVLGGSRGGVLAMLLAAGFLVALTVSRNTASPARALGGLAGVVVAAVLGLLVLGDQHLVRSLLDDSVSGKLLAFRWSLPMIRDHATTGVGRGAFEGAFQPYRGARGDASTIYAHAENLVLDWTSEWGIPVGLLALVGLGAASAVLVARARKDSTRSGLAAAILAVLIGGMVDFGIELFGIAALIVVVLSTAENAAVTPSSSRPWLRFVPAGAAALALVIALVSGARTARAERKTLREATAAVAREPKPSFDEVRGALRAAMLRHPGDAYFPLLGAFMATREGKNPLSWLGRALERNPYSGQAHLALGEALGAARQSSQALIHLRLAAAYDYSLSDRALRRAVELEPNLDALIRAFPSEIAGGAAFVDLCPRLTVESRVDCFREALRRDPHHRKTHEAFALELLDALESGRAPCAGPGAATCEAEAVRASELLGSGGGYRELVISARILARRGDAQRAVTNLLSSCPATSGAGDCLELAVALALEQPDRELARRAVHRFTALACEAPPRCAAAHTFIAEKLEARGDLPGAFEHLLAAAREAPSAGRWLKAADMAARAGKGVAKRSALAEAKSFGGFTPQQQREWERLDREGDKPLVP